MRRCGLLAAVCFAGMVFPALLAASPTAAPEASDSPRRTEHAYVGVYLKSIRHLDPAIGTYEAQLVLSVRWRSSNSIDPSGITADNLLKAEREELSRTTEGAWTRVLWSISGQFHGRFNLADYPFDEPNLRLTVAHPTLPASALRLEPDLDSTGVAEDLDIPGWIFEHRFSVFRADEESARSSSQARPGRDTSQIHFQIYLSRPLISLLTKILLPLLLCLAMGHSAFWLDVEDTSSRLMMVSMAVFSAVCVHFTLSETFPDVGYLVIADTYVFLVYTLLFGYLVGATLTHRLILKGRRGAADHLDRAIRWVFPVILAALAVTLSIPKKPVPPTPPTRPASAQALLVIGTAQEPKRLGPGADGAVERFLTALFIRPLASLDDRWELQPEIASVVPSFANGLWELRPDGSSTVHWTLRPGARWGDGQPIVAEDFVQTHQVFPFHGVRRVQPVADGAVLEYDEARPDALFDVVLLPAHRLQARSALERRALLQNEFPPLSGPFVVERWTPGKELLLQRNPNYVLGAAALERIQVRFFSDKSELIAAVRRGEIGLVPHSDLTPDEAESLAADVPSMTAEVVNSTVVWHLEVNLDDPVLSDVRVRQALLLATDREEMVKEVRGGRGEVAHSWLPVQHEGYDPGIRRWPYDLRAAEAKLEEAGFILTPGGVRQRADGAALRFTIAAIPSRKAEVEFLQKAWKPLGIDVTFEEVPHARFLGEYTARRQFKQLAFYGFVVTPFETGRKRWDQERIPSQKNGWTGENLTGWQNARVSDLQRQLEMTFVAEDRVEMLAEQQAIWSEQLPILPLFTAKSAILRHSRLMNVRPHPSEMAYLSWNAEAWTFAQ